MLIDQDFLDQFNVKILRNSIEREKLLLLLFLFVMVRGLFRRCLLVLFEEGFFMDLVIVITEMCECPTSTSGTNV